MYTLQTIENLGGRLTDPRYARSVLTGSWRCMVRVDGREPTPQRDIVRLRSVSWLLRTQLCELLAASNPERIIYGPGILNSLQVFFAAAKVRRLALGNEEYYDPEHFYAQEVRVFSTETLEHDLDSFRADAVILSAVSWKGRQISVNSVFNKFRRLRQRPLLVVDYSHAGAAGFQSIDQLQADIVCGDFAKWITPPGLCAKISFLYFRSTTPFQIARSVFGRFFLALEETNSSARQARWVDPAEIETLTDWLSTEAIDRHTLLRNYQGNMQLAASLAKRLGLSYEVGTCILWIPGTLQLSDPIIDQLESGGLAWRVPSGDIRILCRAQYAAAPMD